MTTIISELYTEEQLQKISCGTIPEHIAIVMDGNRRWGEKALQCRVSGHPAGAKVVLTTVEAARDLGVKTITLYAFSTENWDRPALEVAAVMTLIEEYLKEQQARMIQEGVKLATIGDLLKLPKSLQNTITECKKATSTASSITMVLALNYGGRDEITRACQEIAKKVKRDCIHPEQISAETVAQHLDTAPWTDPDILIRPGGEHRISNYLLWQLSYTELIFTNTFWPDFTPKDLYEAVLEYQNRERRRGT